MSNIKDVWFVDICYMKVYSEWDHDTDAIENKFVTSTEAVIAFYKKEIKEILEEKRKTLPNAYISRIKQLHIRGLSVSLLERVFNNLLHKINTVSKDLQTYSDADQKYLIQKLESYREVGRYIFRLMEERE